MASSGVNTAFELLQEEIGQVVEHLKKEGAQAFEDGEYETVEQLSKKGKSLELFQKRVSDLQAGWLDEFQPADEGEAGAGPLHPSEQKGEELVMKYAGAEGRALYTKWRVTLLAGSTVKKNVWESLGESNKELRAQCEGDGRLVPVDDGELLRLTKDLVFHSPSGAAQFVAGCSVSGNREWKVKTSGQSLGQWLRQQHLVT
ncbi:MAG: DUF4357 domain-containing protein [Candidatus Thiodiazotropha sp.]